jgi:hypothetical protein
MFYNGFGQGFGRFLQFTNGYNTEAKSRFAFQRRAQS